MYESALYTILHPHIQTGDMLEAWFMFITRISLTGQSNVHVLDSYTLCVLNSYETTIATGTTEFLRPRWSKWGATWPFWSHDANGIINGTTAFLTSRWMKWGTILLFGHMIPLAFSMAPLYYLLRRVKLGTMSLFWSHDAIGIIKGTTAFLTSRWLKWHTMWHFWYHDAIGIGSTWCQWYHQWHHWIP